MAAGINSVAAFLGATGLVTRWLDLGGLTGRLPFGSAVLAGAALALLVGVPQGVLAASAFRRSSLAAAGSVVAGAAMVGWILVEVAFLRVFAGLQAAYVAVGLVQVALGFRLGRHHPGVTPATLARMVGAVMADLPRFLAAPFLRSWHL